MEQAIVLYDVDCGFCRWALAKLLAWDRAGRLSPAAIQDAEADPLLAGMSERQRLASWHVVLPDGRRRSAGPAVPEILRLLPGGRPLAALAATLAPLTNRGYALLARHRSVPGRMLSDAAVLRATARIQARSDAGSLIADEQVAARCTRGSPRPEATASPGC